MEYVKIKNFVVQMCHKKFTRKLARKKGAYKVVKSCLSVKLRLEFKKIIYHKQQMYKND